MAAPIYNINFTQVSNNSGTYVGTNTSVASTYPGTAPTITTGTAGVSYLKNDGSTVQYCEFASAANRVGSIRLAPSFNIPSGAFLFVTYSCATESGSTALMDTTANHGINILVGSAAGFRRWVVGGKDQAEDPASRQQCAMIDPRFTTSAAENNGTFSQTASTYVQLLVRQSTAGENILIGMRSIGYFNNPTIISGDINSVGTFAGLTNAVRDLYTDANRLLELAAPRYQNSQYQYTFPIVIGNGSAGTRFEDKNIQVVWTGHATGITTFPITGDARVHCADNVLGLTVNMSNSFYLVCQNVQFSSPNPWKLSITGIAGQTCDFSGCTFINAGSITLATPFKAQRSIWTKCGRFSLNNCDLTGSTIFQTSSTDGSIDMVNGQTLNSITFDSNAYAIRISTAGTYTLANCIFQGTGVTKHIKVTATTGTVTINLTGSTTSLTLSDVETAGATVVIQSAAQLTLTGLISGSEVRAYVGTDPATATEIAGVESSTTSFSFTHSRGGQNGYIIIASLNYQNIKLDFTYSTTDQSIPIQQIKDRNYENP